MAIEGLTTGRNVHVNDTSGKHWAGVIVKVWDDKGMVNIGGWRDNSAAFWTSVPYDPEQKAPYGYHWIEKA